MLAHQNLHMTIEDKLINLRASEGFRAGFLQTISYLRQQGVISILRDIGRVKPIDFNATNFAENSIAIANWSQGYNAALDHLEEFVDMILYPKNKPEATATATPDYGARRHLVEAGILSEDDYKHLENS